MNPCITPGCHNPAATDSLMCSIHRDALTADVDHLTSEQGMSDAMRTTFATELRGLYLSLTGAGFTEEQALIMVGQTIASMFANPTGSTPTHG